MRGDYAEAERQIASVATRDPDNADVAVTRGIIATQRGEFERGGALFSVGAGAQPRSRGHPLQPGPGLPELAEVQERGPALQAQPAPATRQRNYRAGAAQLPGNHRAGCWSTRSFSSASPTTTRTRPRPGTTWGSTTTGSKNTSRRRRRLTTPSSSRADFHDAHHWLADTFVCQQEYARSHW
ncbi:MAG: hypothetical protein WKG07_07210 [Hymenobacter sp.]